MTMPLEDIKALSDDKLTALVAEKVMGGYLEGDAMGLGVLRKWPNRNRWEPLTDWNHTMQVVAAMRAKGCPFLMRDEDGTLAEVQFGDSYADCQPEKFQRAIFEAAALTMMSGQ